MPAKAPTAKNDISKRPAAAKSEPVIELRNMKTDTMKVLNPL
jgi:hypothetical protein